MKEEVKGGYKQDRKDWWIPVDMSVNYTPRGRKDDRFHPFYCKLCDRVWERTHKALNMYKGIIRYEGLPTYKVERKVCAYCEC